MNWNLLKSWDMRKVYICNRNRSLNDKYPDRIMGVHGLVYVQSGEREIIQDGIPYVARAGDLILLHAGHHHYGQTPCQEEVRIIYVHFSAYKEDFMSDSAMDEGFYRLPVLLHVPKNSEIPYLVEQILKSYWQKDIFAEERASHYLSLLLEEMALVSADGQAAADERELVERLSRTIRSNLVRNYTTRELADMIGVSQKTLHNYFVKITGQPPHAYQISLKLESAREVLAKEPNITLREAAARFGFCDEYHFSKAYRARFGNSPKRDTKGNEDPFGQ